MTRRCKKHEGTVMAVAPGRLTVRIAPEKAKCGGCALSATCSPATALTVETSHAADFRPGDKVVIDGDPTAGKFSMRGGVIYPCAVLIAMSTLMWVLPVGDREASGIALAALAIYYVGYGRMLRSRRGRVSVCHARRDC